MRLVDLKSRVREQLQLLYFYTKVKAKKINDKKMVELAGRLKKELPDCGFALLAFDVENNQTVSNYVSNLNDEFMIKALEMQLTMLKNKAKSAVIINP